MRWDSWLRTWEAHASMTSFAQRLDVAAAAARSANQTCPGMCAALSGGKDGIALAAVLKHAGLNDVRMVHAHTPLNTPGMLESAEETAELLDFDLDVCEPEQDVWQWLREYPREYCLADWEHHKEFGKLFASGNMLVAYQYANGFPGSFTGMRAEESKGRRMNRMIRGKMYQLTSDAHWIAQPIVDWKARDVFACAVKFGLPIHPYYRVAYEELGVSPESPASRVDCMLVSEGATRMPGLHACRVLYEPLWRQIIACRPELESHS